MVEGSSRSTCARSAANLDCVKCPLRTSGWGIMISRHGRKPPCGRPSVALRCARLLAARSISEKRVRITSPCSFSNSLAAALALIALSSRPMVSRFRNVSLVPKAF